MKIAVMPEWWVYLIAIALLALLIYWDYQSRTNKWRLWRLIAIVLAVLSLLGLYMKPYIRTEGETMKVALLTDSQIPVEMDSLRQNGFTIVEDMETYFHMAASQNMNELVVVGDGLEAWELDRIRNGFNYLAPPQMMEGPLEISSREAVTNTLAPLTFRVLINEPMDIHLSGTGIESKMKSLVADEQQVTFEVNPKVAGNLTYQLHGVREGDTLFSELVPMKIRERVGFNTLILTGSPSFELRFLKNLLKEEGYGVAERLQVTKGTFRESFSNLENRSLSRLSKTVLEDFKVLILDKISYDALSYNDKQNVNNALKKGSIGIIWMGDASNEWIKTRPEKAQSLILKSGQKSVELETGGVTSSGYDRSIFFQGNGAGHLHAYGLGKVMLPLLTSTYQLKLKGHDKLYSDLWNALMQPMVGFDFSAPDVLISDFPREDEPVMFTFFLSDEEAVYLDSMRLAVKEKWHQPGVFTALAWPKTKGWNTLQVGNQRFSFFVHGDEDWQAQRSFQKRMQTANYAKRSEKEAADVVSIDRPVSKWTFFTIFLTSLSFLWIEQRVN